VGGIEKAGEVWIFGQSLSEPLVLQSEAPTGAERLGISVAVGDYNNDSILEIAAGASATPGEGLPGGKVYLFTILSTGNWILMPQGSIDNHQTAINGNFGHDISTADWNSDGIDDLFVSAIGNDNKLGHDRQGQQVIFLGPIGLDGEASAEPIIIEDNLYIEGEEGGRFGMSIDARGPLYAVGSPRKDFKGTTDPGVGFVFEKGQAPRNFSPEDRAENGILGYRARLGDFIGDEKLDAAFFSLKKGIYIWESAQPGEPVHIPRLEDACAHWCVGAAVGQIYPGGKEELVIGGSDWSPAGSEKKNTGRFHIVTFDEIQTDAKIARQPR